MESGGDSIARIAPALQIDRRRLRVVRATIELIPFGDENRKQHIGTIEIANNGSGSGDLGNYDVRLSKFDRPMSTWRRGVIVGFRRIKRGPFDLLLAALDTTVGKRR